MEEQSELAAGDFSTWLEAMQAALRGDRAADVPCAGCTACCTSSQFVHIGPEEVETLSRIPKELLFPAPLRPPGHVVLGYDEYGHCPMLVDNQCSIYDHRPITCRMYDCRVFPASGLDAADDDKPRIAERARRWRFTYPTPEDRILHDAVRAAADVARDGKTTTQAAVLAVDLHERFRPRAD